MISATEPGSSESRDAMVQVEIQLLTLIKRAGVHFRAETHAGPWNDLKRSITAKDDEKTAEIPFGTIRERFHAIRVLLELQSFYGTSTTDTLVLDRERLRAIQHVKESGKNHNGSALQMWNRAAHDSALELHAGYLKLLHHACTNGSYGIGMYFREVVEHKLYLDANTCFGGLGESPTLMEDLSALRQWGILALTDEFKQRVGYSVLIYNDVIQLYRKRQICSSVVTIQAHLCDYLVKRATNNRASLYYGEPVLDATLVNLNNIRIALREVEEVK